MSKVYLASGHQGKGTGASKLIDEGVETIVFTDLVLNNLKNVKNVKRSSKGISLASKIREANAFCTSSNDLNIEFHFNSSTSPTSTGCEVVIADKAGALTQKRAKEAQNILTSVLNIKDRGVKTEKQSARGTLGFVSKTKATAMIIEICFVGNKGDVEVYTKKKNELAAKFAEWLGEIINTI